MIELSVVVPVYNVEKYIHRCMNTIINQDYKNYEVILVDDGSTDKSGKICDYYKEQYNNVKVVHKKNNGLGFARNTGLEIAEGKVVTFIDSDDYVDKKMFSAMMLLFEQQQVDTCYCNYARVINGLVIPNTHMENCSGIYKRDEVLNKIIPWVVGGAPEDKFDDIIGYSVCKTCFSMEIIKEHDLRFHSEKEMISEDIIFQLDYLRFAKKIGVLNEDYYYYCLNEGSLSTSYRADRLEKTIHLYDEQLNRLELIGIRDTCQSRVERALISAVRMSIMTATKTLSLSRAIKEIRAFQNNESIREILKCFKINKLPIRQRIFAYFLKYKLSLCTYTITKVYMWKRGT